MTGATRRLAAILSADIEGYSRLMADDEDATIRAVTAHRDLVGRLLEQHRGRLVDFIGDNFMAEFASAVDALECAVEIQQAGDKLNASRPPDRRVVFRIGLHLGEVQVQDHRLFGTGVNVAARLETLGDPGGVCISAQVHREVAGRTDFSFRDLGEHRVKNIPEAVHAFAVGPPGQAAASARLPFRLPRSRTPVVVSAFALLLGTASWWALGNLIAPSVGLPSSLVVLPFDDLSPAGDQDHFAQGMSDELIAELARAPGLEVKGRMTGAAVKRAGLDIQQIGAQTGVTGIIDGSVRRAGDRLRIAVQIVSVSDERNVWSATFERSMGDVFSLQREIARSVAAALDRESGEATRDPTSSVRAYELYLEALRLSRRLAPEEMAKGGALLEEAVSIDADFADAYAAIGNIATNQCVLGYLPCSEVLPRADAAADRAIELDASSAGGWVTRGMVRGRQTRWLEAESSFREAIRIDPMDSTPHLTLGVHLVQVGRIDEGFAQFERALELDPLDPVTLMTIGGAFSSANRDYDRALELSETAARVLPAPSPWIALIQMWAHARSGRLEEAAHAFESMGYPAEMVAPVHAAARTGDRRALYAAILTVMVAASGRPCTQSVSTGASLRLRTGDVDGALGCLQEGFRNGTLISSSTLFSPIWDSVREDPRFQAILRGMNLTPAATGAG